MKVPALGAEISDRRLGDCSDEAWLIDESETAAARRRPGGRPRLSCNLSGAIAAEGKYLVFSRLHRIYSAYHRHAAARVFAAAVEKTSAKRRSGGAMAAAICLKLSGISPM